MFGSEGLRIRGKVFAFIASGGELLVKVPEARADELVAAGTARPHGHARAHHAGVVTVDPGRPSTGHPSSPSRSRYVDELTP